MAAKHTVKLTGNFERNLQEIESFLDEADASHACDALLDELINTVVPHLEYFPGMGPLLLRRPARSIEVTNGITRLTKQLGSLAKDGELREYVMAHTCCCICEPRVLSTCFRSVITGSSRLIFRGCGRRRNDPLVD